MKTRESFQIKHCEAIGASRYRFSLAAKVDGESLYAIRAIIDIADGAINVIEGDEVVNRVMASDLADDFMLYWRRVADDYINEIKSLAKQLRAGIDFTPSAVNKRSIRIKSNTNTGMYFDNHERFVVFDNAINQIPLIDNFNESFKGDAAAESLRKILIEQGVKPFSPEQLRIIDEVVNIEDSVVLDKTDNQFFYRPVKLHDLLKEHGILIAIHAHDAENFVVKANDIVVSRFGLSAPKNGTDIVCQVLRKQGLSVLSPNMLIAEFRAKKSSPETVKFINNRLSEIKNKNQNEENIEKFMSRCLRITSGTGESRSTYLNLLSKLSIHFDFDVRLYTDGSITLSGKTFSLKLKDTSELIARVVPIIKDAPDNIRELLSGDKPSMVLNERVETRKIRHEIIRILSESNNNEQGAKLS